MAHNEGKDGKTTIIFGQPLYDNILAQARVEDMGSGELVRKVMFDYLKSKGLRPDKKPIVTITYEK